MIERLREIVQVHEWRKRDVFKLLSHPFLLKGRYKVSEYRWVKILGKWIPAAAWKDPMGKRT